MSSKRTSVSRRGSRGWQTRSVLKRLLISSVLALSLAATAPVSVPVSNAYAADTVVVDRVEFEEILAGVDSLILERRLLQIDLTEAQRMARADSLMFEERLNIYRERERSWFTKALSHPALWFMLGAYAGLQAAR